MITSVQNDKIKTILKLKKKAKYRKEIGLFVIEGKKLIDEIELERIEEIIVSESFCSTNEHYLKHVIEQNKLVIVSDNVFKHISDAVTPRGILATIKMETQNIQVLMKGNPLIIMLENIQDPGNLGTIIRTADAVGASGLLISEGSVDIYNPKVVRATMGSIFRVPILQDRNLFEDIETLTSKGIKVLAAHLKDDQYIYDYNLTQSVAFLIGNEGSGLTDIADRAQGYVKIPMPGNSESLNVGVATSILVYEAIRQRQFSN